MSVLGVQPTLPKVYLVSIPETINLTERINFSRRRGNFLAFYRHLCQFLFDFASKLNAIKYIIFLIFDTWSLLFLCKKRMEGSITPALVGIS